MSLLIGLTWALNGSVLIFGSCRVAQDRRAVTHLLRAANSQILPSTKRADGFSIRKVIYSFLSHIRLFEDVKSMTNYR